jgi:ArsR family transcriptional regulator
MPRALAEPMPAQRAVALARLFRALADPVRLRLLSLIAAQGGDEICVCHLLPRFELSQPTISYHLRMLRDVSLVDSERRGTWVYYRLRPEGEMALRLIAELPD